MAVISDPPTCECPIMCFINEETDELKNQVNTLIESNVNQEERLFDQKERIVQHELRLTEQEQRLNEQEERIIELENQLS